MQIPLTLLMTRVPVTYFLPAADLLWGVFTLVQYQASSVNQLYAFRFFIGALGGFFFPAVQWYLGAWYKRNELSRRASLFFVASQVGSMSSSYIQVGAYNALNGRHGIEGWRWLYIICFACTIPIAFFGFFMLPGTPDKPTNHWLTHEELVLAKRRMLDERRSPVKAFTWPTIKDTLRGWHFWVLVTFAWFFSQADGVSSNSGFPLWLKQEGHSVESINTLTSISPAITIVWSLFCGVVDDAFGAKTLLITLTGLINAFACIVLAVWPSASGLKMLCFLLAGTADGIAGIIYSWANEICGGSAEGRALTIACMNTIGNVFGAWIPLLVWKTVNAPRYLAGYSFNAVLDAGMITLVLVLRHLWNKERRQSGVA